MKSMVSSISLLFLLASSVFASPIETAPRDFNGDLEDSAVSDLLSSRASCKAPPPGYCNLQVYSTPSGNSVYHEVQVHNHACDQLAYQSEPRNGQCLNAKLPKKFCINRIEDKVHNPAISFSYGGIEHHNCGCHDYTYGSVHLSECYCRFKC